MNSITVAPNGFTALGALWYNGGMRVLTNARIYEISIVPLDKVLPELREICKIQIIEVKE